MNILMFASYSNVWLWDDLVAKNGIKLEILY